MRTPRWTKRVPCDGVFSCEETAGIWSSPVLANNPSGAQIPDEQLEQVRLGGVLARQFSANRIPDQKAARPGMCVDLTDDGEVGLVMRSSQSMNSRTTSSEQIFVPAAFETRFRK